MWSKLFLWFCQVQAAARNTIWPEASKWIKYAKIGTYQNYQIKDRMMTPIRRERDLFDQKLWDQPTTFSYFDVCFRWFHAGFSGIPVCCFLSFQVFLFCNQYFGGPNYRFPRFLFYVLSVGKVYFGNVVNFLRWCKHNVANSRWKFMLARFLRIHKCCDFMRTFESFLEF